MIRLLKNFLKEEDGLGTVEIVVIIAVLVGIALIFRRQIYSFVDQILQRVFNTAEDTTAQPEDNYTTPKTVGQQPQ